MVFFKPIDQPILVKKYKKHFNNGYFVNGDKVKFRDSIFKPFNKKQF